MKNSSGKAGGALALGRAVWCYGAGGLAYGGIELMWRGETHWTMLLLGGFCFLWMGETHFKMRRSVFLRCTVSAVGVTVLEFAAGCLVNLTLGMDVWDYSGAPGNIRGQVCLPYSVLWGILSLFAAPVYGLCRGSFDRRAAAWKDARANRRAPRRETKRETVRGGASADGLPAG